MSAAPPRTTAEKLALFRRCFSGLTHAYGTYDPSTGRVRQVKQPVTDHVLLRHLQGREPYGVYLLVGSRTAAAVADFDQDDVRRPLAFIQRSRECGIAAYLERSKSKGWHAWMFFEPPSVAAAKARAVVRRLLDDVGAPQTEVFPKQDQLDARNRFGNFVNAPLFGALVPQDRTVFVDPENDLKPWPDQWSVLEKVTRISESTLDHVIERKHGLVRIPSASAGSPPSQGLPIRTYGLPPCAQQMLAQGVTQHQRVACFRLALHLKKTGLPEGMVHICLLAWARKNHPTDGKRIITPAEIKAQVRAAFRHDYRGCGCEEPAIQPFCDLTCPVHAGGNTP